MALWASRPLIARAGDAPSWRSGLIDVDWKSEGVQLCVYWRASHGVNGVWFCTCMMVFCRELYTRAADKIMRREAHPLSPHVDAIGKPHM
jgi:hypothetical protein